jgi:hypothetical protein
LILEKNTLYMGILSTMNGSNLILCISQRRYDGMLQEIEIISAMIGGRFAAAPTLN